MSQDKALQLSKYYILNHSPFLDSINDNKAELESRNAIGENLAAFRPVWNFRSRNLHRTHEDHGLQTSSDRHPGRIRYSLFHPMFLDREIG